MSCHSCHVTLFIDVFLSKFAVGSAVVLETTAGAGDYCGAGDYTAGAGDYCKATTAFHGKY